MKILKYNELNEELTYGETLYKYEFSDTIRDYFLEKYPGDLKFLGRYGHAITNNACKNILKFAKHKKDTALINFVLKHMERLTDPDIQANYDLYQKTKKYNL